MGRFLRSPSLQNFERPIEKTQAEGIPSVSTYILGIKISMLTLCLCVHGQALGHVQLLASPWPVAHQ